MNAYRILPLVLILSACVGAPPHGYQPPVVDNSSRAANGAQAAQGATGVQTFPLSDAASGGAVPLPDDGSASAPVPLPDSTSVAQSSNGAVIALLDHADQQAQAGDSDAAAASLERALRIEPRNASLWSRLAVIRLEQGQPDQAEQLALKSNSLSPYDNNLLARNWDTVAKARWARNDAAGARAAEAKAEASRQAH